MKTQFKPTSSRNFVYILLFLAASVFVSAQEANVPEEDGAITETTETSFLQMVSAGGWAMYPLGFLSVAGFALTVYNFMALRPQTFFDDETAEIVREHLGQADIESAKSAAVAEIHAEAGALATAVASKILGREITVADQQQLVQESLAEMKG